LRGCCCLLFLLLLLLLGVGVSMASCSAVSCKRCSRRCNVNFAILSSCGSCLNTLPTFLELLPFATGAMICAMFSIYVYILYDTILYVLYAMFYLLYSCCGSRWALLFSLFSFCLLFGFSVCFLLCLVANGRKTSTFYVYVIRTLRIRHAVRTQRLVLLLLLLVLPLLLLLLLLWMLLPLSGKHVRCLRCMIILYSLLSRQNCSCCGHHHYGLVIWAYEFIL